MWRFISAWIRRYNYLVDSSLPFCTLLTYCSTCAFLVDRIESKFFLTCNLLWLNIKGALFVMQCFSSWKWEPPILGDNPALESGFTLLTKAFVGIMFLLWQPLFSDDRRKKFELSKESDSFIHRMVNSLGTERDSNR